MNDELIKRFISKIKKTKTCWFWIGPIATEGYGQIKIKGVQYMAHRMSYEMNKGPIPRNKVLDHVCRIRHCVNPAHLEVVTQKENVHRGIGEAAINKRKTHCIAGHEFNELNSYVDKTNRRICRVCKKLRMRQFRLIYSEKNREYSRKHDLKRRSKGNHS